MTTSARPKFVALPSGLSDQIVLERAGTCVVGPYDVAWASADGGPLHRDESFSSFTVTTSTGEGLARLDELVPPTPRIRRGIGGLSHGGPVQIVRNGPRLLNRWRQTTVSGNRVMWLACGVGTGAQLVDVETGQRLWRSRGRESELLADLNAEAAALVIALAANEILQSMSLAHARI